VERLCLSERISIGDRFEGLIPQVVAMDTKVISLREAAERLGITAKAVKYRLKVRGLIPVQMDGRYGPTLAISEEQYLAICRPASVLSEQSWGGELPGVGSPESSLVGSPEKVSSPEGTLEDSTILDEVAVSLEPTLAMALNLATKTMEALAAERIEREQAQVERDRAERRAEALAMELGSYRRALAESAESLAEERALRKTIEAREIEDKQHLELLKLDTPARGSGGWGQRVRRWFGLANKTG